MDISEIDVFCERLFRRFFPEMTAVARRMLPNSATSVANSTCWHFLSAARAGKIQFLSDPEQLKAYILAIVRNRCRTRKRQKFVRNAAPLSDVGEWLVSEADDPVAEAIARELGSRLKSRLGQRSWEVLQRRIAKQSHAEIGEAIGLSEVTARREWRRVQDIVLDELQKEGFEC